MQWIKRLATEPMVHFLLLGAVIFAWFAFAAPQEPVTEARQIVISRSLLERATLAWTQRAQREPTPVERQGIIDEVVREEVLYREALALGLDRDDVVIRSLLRQKFEFVTQDLGFDAEPDGAVLRAFHAANADRYRRAERLSFSQIAFSEDKRGPAAEADARRALADLQSGAGPEAAEVLGDGGALAPSYPDLADHEIEALFGPDFAKAILSVAPGRWSDPIRSSYGIHLVWVDSRTDGGLMPFEDVVDRVRADWMFEARRAANEAIYRALLDRYEVTLEPAVPPAGDPAAP
jgi:peptidyl-prolyl cis-trans isomerase C